MPAAAAELKPWQLSEAALKLTVFLAVAAITSAASGCTSEQAYSSGQAWRRNECNKMPDSERERCMGKADMSYETYRREAEGAKRP